MRFCHIGTPLALSTILSLSLIGGTGAGCSDDGDTHDSDATDTTAADTSSDATPDTAGDTSTGGCATGLASGMSGTWAMEETQTALVQVDPFGTMTQVSTSLYLAKLSGSAQSTITMTLCAWQTKDDAGLFTTTMGDGVLAHLDPFVRDLHISDEDDGTVGLQVSEGIALRGVTLANPATDAMPEDADDERVIDQDEDSNPGISLVISGTLSGQLFVIHRHKASLDGCFTAADRVVGLTDWTTEQIIVGSNPESLQASKPVASTHPDASLSHFTMVKVGDDATCADLIDQRDTLF